MKAHLYVRLSLLLSMFWLIALAWCINSPVYGQAANTDQSTVKADSILNDATRQQVQDLVKQRNYFPTRSN